LRRSIIAISGTPGTGKSVFARALAKKLGASVIELNTLITKKKIYKLDADGTKIANLPKMREEFARAVKECSGPVVVEGLLAHLLQKRLLTHVVVLRTKPSVLERRLRARGYSKTKTRENVEAEALDIILWEAVDAHYIDKVYEIDTTKLRPDAEVNLFLKAFERKISLRPSKVNWLAEVF
jgi:adenylate kinase